MCGKLPSPSRRAMTLPEMMMAIAVSSVILTALLSFTVYASRSFAALTNYVELEQRSQDALDQMTRDVRETQGLTNYTTMTLDGQTITNSVTFIDFDNQLLSFTFTNDVLVRSKAGATTMLLTNVDFLTFQIYQRNTVSGSYNQFPTANIAEGKLIAVSWICSRSILGARMNTESVQTAKIVIRKK